MRAPQREADHAISLIDRFASADEKGQAEQYREVFAELATALKEEGAKNLLHSTSEQFAAYAVTVTPERAAEAKEALQALQDAGARLNAEKAAIAELKNIQKETPERLASVATNAAFKGVLSRFAVELAKSGETLKSVTVTQAMDYLKGLRDAGLSQKTIDQNRQGIQAMMQARGKLAPNEHLERVLAGHETVLTSRAYSSAQIDLICSRQSERYALATQIMYSAGVRAEELLTLRPLAERAPDVRHYEDGSVKSLPEKFLGREGVAYTVQGKGGLIREVRIRADLAEKLEAHRRAKVVTVTDRGIRYKESAYDIPGGSRVSSSFSKASQKSLGWSHGAHGCRHSYAQERMSELQECGLPYERALEVVSQEMGHFRHDITLTYLR